MADNINPDHYKRLPAEAIKIIESAIQNAPSNRDAYLHGQVLEYVLPCWNKNGIEDLRKAKWYLDRLVDSLDESEQQKAADLQSLKDHPFGKMKEQPSTTQPPDGWRWLEVGETLRRGDTTNTIDEIPETCIDTKCVVKHFALRRNRYEVGEKVVYIQDESVWDYISEINDGPNHPKSAHVASGSTSLRVCVTRLAPYIEESK